MKNKLTNKTLFAAILALATLACSSAATNLTVNTTNASNANSGAILSPSPTPNAPTIAPDALVADLYKQHNADKSPFFQDKDRALVDKYFTKATADLIWKDATKQEGEDAALNADPLYDAQDTDIKNFKVGQAEIKDKSATVPVTFENFGKKKKLIFALVEENSSWKIQDIKYDRGYTLVNLLKENSSTNSKNNSEGKFEGKYQVGDTTCTVKPTKMAYEVKWEKGAGTETYFSKSFAKDKYIFTTDDVGDKDANVFAFDDDSFNTGTFYRADGKEFPVKRIK